MKFSDMLALSDNELKDLFLSLNQDLLHMKVRRKISTDKSYINKTRSIKKDVARLKTLFKIKGWRF